MSLFQATWFNEAIKCFVYFTFVRLHSGLNSVSAITLQKMAHTTVFV